MSYDVYWVKNRAEKIADFEHPTRRGTDAFRMMLRMMIVGPALRNQGMVMSAYPTAALLRSLQWVSDRYVSPRDTALTMYNNLLWKAAWLRRDAIASYVCLVCYNSNS